MTLTIQLLAIAVLVLAFFAARRYTRRNTLPRPKSRGGHSQGPRMSARTEMRAFDSLTTVTRTVDLNAARKDRALRRARARSRRRAAT